MKKSCKRKPRPIFAPTMIAMLNNPEVGIQERMSIEAMVGGWAQKTHFNQLADCRDMLLIAAKEKDANDILGVCALAGIALTNIRERYDRTGRFGATGDEVNALRFLADVSEDFWLRQGGGQFIRAEMALSRSRELYKKEKVAV